MSRMEFAGEARLGARRVEAPRVEASRSDESAARLRTERALRALGRIARVMAFAADEQTFLQEVCRIIVDECGPLFVWIGLTDDDDDKTIRPVAHAGLEQGYLQTLRLTWADTDRGRGPAGTSIRTQRATTCTNIHTDLQFLPWRDEAIKRGYGSAIALPLIASGKAFGTIAAYAAAPDAFPDDEQNLLTELADDVSAGITAIRFRSAHARAERASREHAEKLLQALEQAERRKDHFLARLTHELRNPLMPIRNGLRLLDGGAPGAEQAKRAVAIIARQVDQLTRLIDDLMDLTRISQGKIALHRELVDLRELLMQAVEDYAPAFSQRGIDLSLTPCEAVYLRGDRGRLAQVVGNLLQNAAKFTPRGGRTRVDLEGSGGISEAIIRVRDTGIGIAADMVAQVFEPFVQGPSADANRGGLGLGLAVVKGIIELHGGSVAIDSEGTGKGTELVVRLPFG
jgi:signal transduction histidine kinase